MKSICLDKKGFNHRVLCLKHSRFLNRGRGLSSWIGGVIIVVVALQLGLNHFFFLLEVGATRVGTFAPAFQPLAGVQVNKVVGTSTDSSSITVSATTIDVGKWMERKKCLIVFGTYAADFSAIEYAQRLRYYLPQLQERASVTHCAMIVNGSPEAARKLAQLTDLPVEVSSPATTKITNPSTIHVELWSDPMGKAGRAFGVSRGWLPDSTTINPFVKLFGMFWGLGAWATLPAVIGGYIGNPFSGQPWIEDALAVGQRLGRWPDTALELSDSSVNGTSHSSKGVDDVQVRVNKFENLPLVGSWPRRPLELATLRLQSMLGISLQHWQELAPDQDALDAGVLTQLGGCLVVDVNGDVLFDWKDPGICAVAKFEDILRNLSPAS